MKGFQLLLPGLAVHWTDKLSSNCQGCSCDDHSNVLYWLLYETSTREYKRTGKNKEIII